MSGHADDNIPKMDVSAHDTLLSYQRPLFRYFLRQGLDVADANDCVQEVFSRVIRKGDISGFDNPQGYIFAIASNLLKDKARRERSTQKRDHTEVDEALLYCEQPSQDRILAAQQELAIIKKAILDMPPKVRDVFVLSRFDGLKYKEIAAVMGISVSSVEKYMMRALQRLNRLRDSL